MTTLTPQSRRSFLTTLAGLALAPVIAARALAAAKPAVSTSALPVPWTDNPAWIYRDLLSREENRVACERAARSILVPSNRIVTHEYDRTGSKLVWADYHGDWDGTLKLEAGCTNPAYVLADLIHREGHYFDGGSTRWQALYDWGVWADELTPDWTMMYDDRDTHLDQVVIETRDNGRLRPRFTLDTVCRTDKEREGMRENLHMHFRVWQSTDPRYQRSFPGVPYPGDVS